LGLRWWEDGRPGRMDRTALRGNRKRSSHGPPELDLDAPAQFKEGALALEPFELLGDLFQVLLDERLFEHPGIDGLFLVGSGGEGDEGGLKGGDRIVIFGPHSTPPW
jgi:hypothetical protein